MGVSAASITPDISDGESKSAKFKLLFGSAEISMDIFHLTPQIKAFKIYCLNSRRVLRYGVATTCQFFRAMFFRSAMFSF